MKIVSLNIWDLPVWFVQDRDERLVLINNFLKNLDPDIICLQESFDPEHRRQLNDLLRVRGYETSDKDVRRRSVLGRMMDMTGGLVTYAKFPIRKNRFIPFSRLFFSPIEYLGRKGGLITSLDTPYGIVRIINAHLSKGFICPQTVRLQQMKKILRNIPFSELITTIMVGDFNQRDLARNKKFLKLIKENHFIFPVCDAFAPSYRAENVYVNIWMNRITRSKRIDYFLCSNLDMLHLRPKQCAAVYSDPPLSDHDPVVLDLRPV